MILYLQVGFEFIYDNTSIEVKDTATFCPFWGAMV